MTAARPVSSQVVLEGYAAGERDFRGLDIEDPEDAAPLRGALLADVDLRDTFLVVDFGGATLHRARFAGANAKTCSFAGADLSGADFSNAALDGTTFAGADLNGARFDGAHLQGHVLRGSERPDG